MLTIIFIFSLFSIAIMTSLKMIEERRQEKLLFSELRESADTLAKKIIDDAENFFSVLNKNNGKLFAIFIGHIITRGASDVRRKSRLRKLKFLNSLKINKNLKKKGSASFFLRNVSEYENKYIK